MTYETKSGAQYCVHEWMGSYCIWRKEHGLSYPPDEDEFQEYFPTRESAETALKAYADSHPGWKVVEE